MVRHSGAYPETCAHPQDFTQTEWVVYPPDDDNHVFLDRQDWNFANTYLLRPNEGEMLTPKWYDGLEKRQKATSMRCCADCYTHLPSVRMEADRKAHKPVIPEVAKTQQTEFLEVRDRVEEGEAIYLCNDCNQFKDQEDLVKVLECPHCDEAFDGSSEGRNCPLCNRPFSRLLTEEGCPDCLSEDQPELVTLELLDSMMEDTP